jgi:hypothetical protein
MEVRLDTIRHVKIMLVNQGKLIRLRFRSDENTQQPVVEMDFPPSDLMAVMVALQQFQARHRIPIPASLRPQGAPPLSIVSD